MPEYLTPGVYVEEVSFRAPSIEGVGTSTTGFAGVTLTGPYQSTPELITSFGDFSNTYGGDDNLALTGYTGDPTNSNYLAMGVKACVENGGSCRPYVSRVFVPRSPTDTGVAAKRDGKREQRHQALGKRFPGRAGRKPDSHGAAEKLRAARTWEVCRRVR